MTDLSRRIDRLEGATADKPAYVVVTASPDEPAEAAVARYRTEHPTMPADAHVIIFVTGFTIAARDPLP